MVYTKNKLLMYQWILFILVINDHTSGRLLNQEFALCRAAEVVVMQSKGEPPAGIQD